MERQIKGVLWFFYTELCVDESSEERDDESLKPGQ